MVFAIHWHESAMGVHVFSILNPLPHSSPFHPSGSSQWTALSTLSHASNQDWRSVSHMVIYMFQCYSLKSSHPRLLPQSSKVCSLHLYLFHLANIINCFVSYTVLGAGDIAVNKMLAIVHVNFIKSSFSQLHFFNSCEFITIKSFQN